MRGDDEMTFRMRVRHLRLADCANETLSATCARNNAELDLWLTKDCLLTSVDDVAHHSNLTSTSEGEAVDRCTEVKLNAVSVCALLVSLLVLGWWCVCVLIVLLLQGSNKMQCLFVHC